MFQICNKDCTFLEWMQKGAINYIDYNTVGKTIKIMQFMTVIIGSTT